RSHGRRAGAVARMPEADGAGGSATQASARDGRGDQAPGADIRLEHLSRRAEYYSRLSRTGSGHSANDDSHLFRGRGEGDIGAAARSADVRADADRISAGKVRTDQAPAGERGRVPGQIRQALEELSAARFSEAIEGACGVSPGASFFAAKYQRGSSRRSSMTLPARCRTWSCCESNEASTAGSDLPPRRYASAACANRS